MTDEQKKQIETLRLNGCGYTRIAQMIGISENTVKSFCRRNKLTGSVIPKMQYPADAQEHFCQCCGVVVEQNPGRKEKKFCSDKCRMKWWNSHPEQVNRKAVYEFICVHCEKPFTAYGNANRKYCSQECYIADKLGGARR